MAMAKPMQLAMVGAVLAAGALIVALLWNRDEVPATVPGTAASAPAAPAPAAPVASSADAASAAEPAPAAPAAPPIPAALISPVPAASPAPQGTIDTAEQAKRTLALTETYRRGIQRQLLENDIDARLEQLQCTNAHCRGTLVDGTPDAYKRWAEVMRREAANSVYSFQWSQHNVDGNRQLQFAINVIDPAIAAKNPSAKAPSP